MSSFFIIYRGFGSDKMQLFESNLILHIFSLNEMDLFYIGGSFSKSANIARAERIG